MKFVDSHAHYNDLRFEEEFPGGADVAIFASHDAGAAYILNAGTNMQTSLESIALSQKFPFVFAAAGIHPYDCAFIEESVDSAIAEIEPLLSDPAVRAIGEIGLDYHYDGIDREKQKEYFIAQLELARTTGMPVVIHDRDEVLRRRGSYPPTDGTSHFRERSPTKTRGIFTKPPQWFPMISSCARRMHRICLRCLIAEKLIPRRIFRIQFPQSLKFEKRLRKPSPSSR